MLPSGEVSVTGRFSASKVELALKDSPVSAGAGEIDQSTGLRIVDQQLARTGQQIALEIEGCVGDNAAPSYCWNGLPRKFNA